MSRIRDRLKEQYIVEILPCRKVTDIVSLEKKWYSRTCWKDTNLRWNLTN